MSSKSATVEPAKAPARKSESLLSRAPEVPTEVRDVLRQTGEPLDPAIRVALEEQLAGSRYVPIRPTFDVSSLKIGASRDGQEAEADSVAEGAPRKGAEPDLTSVRIHRGPAAEAAARAIRARAFAVGEHIVFGKDVYQPESPVGRRLLAHELAHLGQPGAESTIRRKESTEEKPVDPAKLRIPDKFRVPPVPNANSIEKLKDVKAPKIPDATPMLKKAKDLAEVAEKTKGLKDVKAAIEAKDQKPPEPAKPEKKEPEKISDLSTGGLDLIDSELAEHERWGSARAKVGDAGSAERAKFIATSGGQGSQFMKSAAEGAFGAVKTTVINKAIEKGVEKAAIKLATKMAAKLGTQVAKFTPLPAVGAVIGGVMAAYDLANRDWKATGESIGKFGQGSDLYDALANTIESISTIIEVASSVLSVIAGVIGAISIAMWAITVATVGVAAPLAGTLSTIAGLIGFGTMVMDTINSLILKQLITIFRTLHTFDSEADPRDVVTQGKAIQQAAADSSGALGGFVGGKLADKGIGKVAKRFGPKEPHAPVPDHPDPAPAAGKGPIVTGTPPVEGKAPAPAGHAEPTPKIVLKDQPREAGQPSEPTKAMKVDEKPHALPEPEKAPKILEPEKSPKLPEKKAPELKESPAEQKKRAEQEKKASEHADKAKPKQKPAEEPEALKPKKKKKKVKEKETVAAEPEKSAEAEEGSTKKPPETMAAAPDEKGAAGKKEALPPKSEVEAGKHDGEPPKPPKSGEPGPKKEPSPFSADERLKQLKQDSARLHHAWEEEIIDRTRVAAGVPTEIQDHRNAVFKQLDEQHAQAKRKASRDASQRIKGKRDELKQFTKDVNKARNDVIKAARVKREAAIAKAKPKTGPAAAAARKTANAEIKAAKARATAILKSATDYTNKDIDRIRGRRQAEYSRLNEVHEGAVNDFHALDLKVAQEMRAAKLEGRPSKFGKAAWSEGPALPPFYHPEGRDPSFRGDLSHKLPPEGSGRVKGVKGKGPKPGSVEGASPAELNKVERYRQTGSDPNMVREHVIPRAEQLKYGIPYDYHGAPIVLQDKLTADHKTNKGKYSDQRRLAAINERERPVDKQRKKVLMGEDGTRQGVGPIDDIAALENAQRAVYTADLQRIRVAIRNSERDMPPPPPTAREKKIAEKESAAAAATPAKGSKKKTLPKPAPKKLTKVEQEAAKKAAKKESDQRKKAADQLKTDQELGYRLGEDGLPNTPREAAEYIQQLKEKIRQSSEATEARRKLERLSADQMRRLKEGKGGPNAPGAAQRRAALAGANERAVALRSKFQETDRTSPDLPPAHESPSNPDVRHEPAPKAIEPGLEKPTPPPAALRAAPEGHETKPDKLLPKIEEQVEAPKALATKAPEAPEPALPEPKTLVQEPLAKKTDLKVPEDHEPEPKESEEYKEPEASNEPEETKEPESKEPEAKESEEPKTFPSQLQKPDTKLKDDQKREEEEPSQFRKNLSAIGPMGWKDLSQGEKTTVEIAGGSVPGGAMVGLAAVAAKRMVTNAVNDLKKGVAESKPVVEQVNPNYQEPPCRPQQIVDIQNDILQTLDARSKAEEMAQHMAGQEKEHKANEEPLGKMKDKNDEAVDAKKAHEDAVGRRTEANQKKQGAEKDSGSKISEYSTKAGSLTSITKPMWLFSKFTGLASSLPDDPGVLKSAKWGILKMSSDSKRFLDKLKEADSTMADQKNNQGTRMEAAKADGDTLKSTKAQAADSGEKLKKNQDDTETISKANDERKSEAGKIKNESNQAANSMSKDAADKTAKSQSLAAALQAWAQGHKQAREDALAKTHQKMEAMGYTEIQMSEK